MNKYKNVLIAQNLLIVSIIFVLWLMGYSLQKKGERGRRPAPKGSYEKYVQADSVELKNITSKIYAFGRVQSSKSLQLTAEVQGRIIRGSVPLETGQNFKKGDLLYQIDDREFRLGVQAKKSAFINRVATLLPDIKIDFADSYDKWKNYYDQLTIDHTIPEIPKVVSLKERTFLANKNVLSDYLAIKADEERLAKYKFYAPFNGAFAQVDLEEGALLGGGTKVGRIIQTGEMELKIPVRIEEVKWLKEGAKVYVQDNSGTYSSYGKVIRIGDAMDPKTQSVEVIAQLDHKVDFYEGMYFTAELDGKVIAKVIEVPRHIVKDNKVYLVNGGRITEKTIVVEKENPDTYILSGLTEEEVIVMESLSGKVLGMNVKVIQ